MPICTNPKCGQITKTMSLYCPSCGQQTLSKVDRGQVDGPHSSEISMENFDRITADVPAPHEKSKRERSKRKKKVRSYKKFSRPQFSLVPKFRGRKTFWVVVLVLGLGLYVLSKSNPNLLPQEVNASLSAIKRTAVQLVPTSEAYQLGFKEGNNIRIIEETGKAVSEHFESYGQDAFYGGSYGQGAFGGGSVEDQIRNCETTVTIDPEGCEGLIRKMNAPGYKREMYQKYAEDMWSPMGLLNFLENTQKNRNDFISGFMTGLFG